MNQQPQKEQDQRRMNQFLFNRDVMYYHILVHAMNHGMVDVVIDVLSFWVPIFQACRKHKYARHLSNSIFRLCNNWAPRAWKEVSSHPDLGSACVLAPQSLDHGFIKSFLGS